MDHVSRTIVPAFYRYLQAQDQNAQIELGKEFISSLEGLVVLLERAEHEIIDAGVLQVKGR
jgi:glutathione S-transferase